MVELIARQSTLVAVHSGYIHLHGSGEILDAAVNPALARTHAQTVELIAGNATVKAPYHHVDRAVQTEAHL